MDRGKPRPVADEAGAVISRLLGAAIRAFLVILLIATPSLILPGTTADVAQIVTLVALFGAGLTFFEYASTKSDFVTIPMGT